MKKIVSIITLFTLLLIAVGCKGDSVDEEFKLKAKVIKVDNVIEVEVMESDYAYGVYWVLTSNDTEFISKSGEKIQKQDIKEDSVIEIVYGGQVMMSYPPQIAAVKVTVIE